MRLSAQDSVFLLQVRKVFSSCVCKYVLGPFLSLSSFWDPCDVNVGKLNVTPEIF